MNNSDVGFEPWLAWLLSAFLPLAGSLVLPGNLRPYCLIASGMLFVVAIVNLVRLEMRKRSRDVHDS